MKSLKLRKFSVEKLKIENIKAWISTLDRKTVVQNVTIASAFLAFLIFFFLPVLMYNKKISSDARKLKDKVGQGTVKIIRIPEMTRQKELFGARIKKVREQFFDVKESDQLIEIISTLAGEAAIQISASRPSVRTLEIPKPFGEKYMALSYDLVVEGPYHNLGMFINKLEHFGKHFAVHELSIVGGDTGTVNHQCTLVLTAFVKRPELVKP